MRAITIIALLRVPIVILGMLTMILAIALSLPWALYSDAEMVFPPVTIFVVAPREGIEHFMIDYSCDFQTNTGSLLPELADATEKVLDEVGGWYGIAVARRGLCKQIQLVKAGISPRLDSKHLIGAAVDFYCYDKTTKKAIYDCDWEKIGRACRRNGLIWGGDFPNPDPMHCELPPLQSL